LEVGNRKQDESRREFLVKSLAGLGLSFVLPGMDLSAARQRGSERRKSLITLWLAGGPSQLETWDPHPGGGIGGPTRAIDTRIAGLKIAEFYPRLAEQIDSLSIIRSMVSKEGDHERGTYFMKTGYRPDPTLTHPSIGAILAHQLPASDVEIPLHVSLGGSPWPARGGFLGDRFDAFKIYDPGRNIRNMRSQVGQQRQQRRLTNLEVVSQAFRQGRRLQIERTLHQHTVERALKLMSSEQLKAFDLDEAPKAVQESYGDTNFGRGCLVARRLVEQGVRAVEVTLPGFDSHANNFAAHQQNGAILDPAIARLIQDLKQRDLLDSTVVLCIGEFGRTPKVNPLDGRDHWPTGFSCLLGGGGLHSGLVLGATDPEGNKKDPQDPIQVQDLYATILKVMGVDHETELITPIGRPMAFSSGTPIERLILP
jgi:hypothetical protein